MGKIKTCQTWQYHVGQLALKWTFKLYDKFSPELVSVKSKRVKLMELLQYFSDVEVLELNGFVRFKLDGRVVLLNCHL